jgi:hypothetical protein
MRTEGTVGGDAMRTDSLVLMTDEHELYGVFVHGRWVFSSRSWPALAANHDGAASPDAIVLEFLARALGVALVPLESASGGGQRGSYDCGDTPRKSSVAVR